VVNNIPWDCTNWTGFNSHKSSTSIASEEVTLQLVKSKYLPIFMGLSATLCSKPIYICGHEIFTARCYASAVFAVMQCPSVCPSVRPSVTFVDHVKTNKHIFEIFSPLGSDTILVFLYQRGCRYSDGNPPKSGVEGVECKGYDKMTIFSQISRSISETVIVRWAHAATQFVSIEFFFHPYNI